MQVTIAAEPGPLRFETERSTVLVVDVQNATTSSQGSWSLSGLHVSGFRKIFDPINSLTSAFRRMGRRSVYLVHLYSPDFRELGDPDSVLWVRSRAYRDWLEHPEWNDRSVIRGTWGAQVAEEVKPAADDIIVEKSRYSGFWGTSLDTVLRRERTRYLIVVGVMANICVEATVRDAFYYGYYPIYVTDAVATPSVAIGDATINNARSYGWVTDSAEILRAIAG